MYQIKDIVISSLEKYVSSNKEKANPRMVSILNVLKGTSKVLAVAALTFAIANPAHAIINCQNDTDIKVRQDHIRKSKNLIAEIEYKIEILPWHHNGNGTYQEQLDELNEELRKAEEGLEEDEDTLVECIEQVQAIEEQQNPSNPMENEETTPITTPNNALNVVTPPITPVISPIVSPSTLSVPKPTVELTTTETTQETQITQQSDQSQQEIAPEAPQKRPNWFKRMWIKIKSWFK